MIGDLVYNEDGAYSVALNKAAVPSRVLDDIEPLPDTDGFARGYREAALRGLSVLNSALAWVYSSRNPKVALAQVSFAVGSGLFDGAPMESVGSRLGVSRACLSKGSRAFCAATGIEPVGALKRNVDAYRRARKSSIERANVAARMSVVKRKQKGKS